MTDEETRADIYGTEEEWEHYRDSLRQIAEGPQNAVGAKSYNPSPKEIRRRIKDLQWLQKKEFSDDLQDAIMIHDCPVVSTVRHLVRTVGLKETKLRLERFISDE